MKPNKMTSSQIIHALQVSIESLMNVRITRGELKDLGNLLEKIRQRKIKEENKTNGNN